MSHPWSAARKTRQSLASLTVNETIPLVLTRSLRAKLGVANSRLLRADDISTPPSAVAVALDAPAVKRPQISVVDVDTLQAAYDLSFRCGEGSDENIKGKIMRGERVAVLSMASEYKPGGGFLSGASAQEEFLCMRTTLYASLLHEYYRLPDLGCVYSPDVCVFRGTYDEFSSESITADQYITPDEAVRRDDGEAGPSEHSEAGASVIDMEKLTLNFTPEPAIDESGAGKENNQTHHHQSLVLQSTRHRRKENARRHPIRSDDKLALNPQAKWWFVDVISCPGVRRPAIDKFGAVEKYANASDRELMLEKIKRVLRVAAMNGNRRLVLGALGCGAFGNPPAEVALLFKRALMGRQGMRSGWMEGEFVGCFDAIVFAIKGGRKENLSEFRKVFQVASEV